MKISSVLLESNTLPSYNYVKDFCKDKNVLDVGCGFGLGGYFIVSNGAKSYTGIDIFGHAIQYAKTHFQSNNITFLLMNAENITINKKFDVIVSFEVIEHLNYLGYLNGIKNSLKDDGYFFLSTPNKTYTLRQLNKIPRFHKCEFDEAQLKLLLSQFFKVVEIKGMRSEIKLNKGRTTKDEIFDVIKNIFPYNLEKFYLDRNTVGILPEIKPLDLCDIEKSESFFVSCKWPIGQSLLK
jgi:SAM-dependent methyltransferase